MQRRGPGTGGFASGGELQRSGAVAARHAAQRVGERAVAGQAGLALELACASLVVGGGVCVGLGEQLGATDAIGPEGRGGSMRRLKRSYPRREPPLTPVTGA